MSFSQDFYKIPEKDFFWLVGLLEGEGNFSITKNNIPRIRLQMTDLDIIARVANMLDIPIYTHEHKKPKKTMYEVSYGGEKASHLMQELFLYMGNRCKKQISIVFDTLSKNGKFYRDYDYLAYREELIQKGLAHLYVSPY